MLLSASTQHAAICASSQLSGLHSLHIIFPLDGGAFESFAPLAAAPRLRSPQLESLDRCDLTDARIGELRALTQLEVFEADHEIARILQAAHPQPLQWRRLCWLCVDEESAPLLATLPALTDLNVCELRLAHLDFLLPLQHLSALCLDPSSSNASAAALVAGLQRCPQLTSLALLYSNQLHAEHLAAILERLPLLSSLNLYKVASVASLSFLSAGRLSDTLTRLHVDTLGRDIWTALQFQPEDLAHINGLRSLQSLELRNAFRNPLPQETLAVYGQRPCPPLPALTHFSHYHPFSFPRLYTA